ncbi:MAG: response regulator [Phenylobacterium sp.]|nr:MAG: response regulator [Phenylobacterium sp.]
MRVLYVDDEEPNRRVMASMLKKAGIEMAQAADADTGLWMVADQHFDLVLMDIRMPGKDGFSAIGEIRAHRDAKKDVPIIVVTADDAYDIRLRARAVGANDILIKPVSKEQLLQAIGRLIPNWGGPKAA